MADALPAASPAAQSSAPPSPPPDSPEEEEEGGSPTSASPMASPVGVGEDGASPAVGDVNSGTVTAAAAAAASPPPPQPDFDVTDDALAAAGTPTPAAAPEVGARAMGGSDEHLAADGLERVPTSSGFSMSPEMPEDGEEGVWGTALPVPPPHPSSAAAARMPLAAAEPLSGVRPPAGYPTADPSGTLGRPAPAVLECDGAYISTDVPSQDELKDLCYEYADGLLEGDDMAHMHSMIEAMQRRYIPLDQPPEAESTVSASAAVAAAAAARTPGGPASTSRSPSHRSPPPGGAAETARQMSELVASALQYMMTEEEMRRDVIAASAQRAWDKLWGAVVAYRESIAAALVPKREKTQAEKDERKRKKELKRLMEAKKAELHRAWMESRGLAPQPAGKISEAERVYEQRKIDEANRMTQLLRREFKKSKPPFATAKEELWARDVIDKPGEVGGVSRNADEYHQMAAALRRAYWSQRIEREEEHRETIFRAAQSAAQHPYQRAELHAHSEGLRYLGSVQPAPAAPYSPPNAREAAAATASTLSRYEYELAHGPTTGAYGDRPPRAAQHHDHHRPAWKF